MAATELVLDEARDALERGRLRRALRLAWHAGAYSASGNDDEGLQRTIELAEAIRDRSRGRPCKEASMLVDYCTYSRANPARRGFGWLRPPSRR